MDCQDAPENEANKFNVDTASLIHESSCSPSVGQAIENIAQWMKHRLGSVDLDAHHFAIRVSYEDNNVIV